MEIRPYPPGIWSQKPLNESNIGYPVLKERI